MNYVKPDFDVTNYEIEDILTISVVDGDVDTTNAPGTDWDDFGDF